MKHMYNWIRRHKIICALIILLSPLFTSGFIYFGGLLQHLLGIKLNILNLSGSDYFIFYSAVLGGFATLLAVLITVEQASKDQQQMLRKEITPILVLTPTLDTAQNGIAEYIGSTDIYILDGQVQDFALPSFAYRKYSYDLCNYGKEAAINVTMRWHHDEMPKQFAVVPVCIVPTSKYLVNVFVDEVITTQEKLDLVCISRNIIGERIQYSFRITAGNYNGEVSCGVNLMPQITPLDFKTHDGSMPSFFKN